MIHLRNLATHDFWLKLFSLALAILIWITIRFAKEGGLGVRPIEKTYSIPVRIVSSSADVSGFRPDPAEVEIKVRGDTRKLERVQIQDLRALVDLTGIEPATGLRKRIDITTPVEVTLLAVVPDGVQIVPIR